MNTIQLIQNKPMQPAINPSKFKLVSNASNPITCTNYNNYTIYYVIGIGGLILLYYFSK